jgi:orotidine-5'-phosphate decarboxylase
MDFKKKLQWAEDNNNSLVCVGLDSDLKKLPASFKNVKKPQLEFNKAIIDATADLVSSYKANSAFYEALGADGLEQLRDTVAYINKKHPNIPVLLDAKRADIGNTNDGYIDYVFNYLGMDAVTLHPYLGGEALQPFLDLKDKGMIILCRTSNPGAAEFQDLQVNDRPLYEEVAETVATKWNANKNCLLVVGATYPEEMKAIRKIVGPDMPFLVPGVGAQGGDVEAVLRAGLANNHGLIINSSRGIIFASSGDDFAEAARNETIKLRDDINKYRS